MEFKEVLSKRRSIRTFSDQRVPSGLIEQIIKLANSSPSAGNIQARAVVIVRNKKLINTIKQNSRGLINFGGEIPVLLVILAKPKESAVRYRERGESLYSLQDATILASYIQLIATSEGLSTCWVGYFDEKKIKKYLNLPVGLRPVAIIPLGYAGETPSEKSRKKIEDIVFNEI